MVHVLHRHGHGETWSDLSFACCAVRGQHATHDPHHEKVSDRRGSLGHRLVALGKVLTGVLTKALTEVPPEVLDIDDINNTKGNFWFDMLNCGISIAGIVGGYSLCKRIDNSNDR